MSGAACGSAAHHFTVRVYYEDTDFGGVVYHANYLKYMERARTEWLRGLGFSQAALREETGLAFVVRRMAIEFQGPALMDDELSVRTTLKRVGAASLELSQTVEVASRVGDAPARRRLIEAAVTIACVSQDGRPARLPASLRAVLAEG